MLLNIIFGIIIDTFGTLRDAASDKDHMQRSSCFICGIEKDTFDNHYQTTIGIDFGVKPVKLGGQSVRVNFWDLAGGDEYFEIRNEFYKDAQGGVMTWDELLAHMDSLSMKWRDAIKDWHKTTGA